MVRKRRIVMLTIIVLLLLIVGIFIFFQDYLPWKKNRAKQMAEQYLQELYIKKEMEFVDVYVRDLSLESSYQYWVVFRDKEYPEITFHVEIPNVMEDRCFDDYLECFFIHECEKAFQSQMIETLGDHTEIYILMESSYLSRLFDSPIENFNIKEIDDVASYCMYIMYEPVTQDIETTKEKMWEAVQLVQSGDYTPDKIIFEDKTERIEDITLSGDQWSANGSIR